MIIEPPFTTNKKYNQKTNALGQLNKINITQPIIFTANQAMALYKFRLGAMLHFKQLGFEVIAIAPDDNFGPKIKKKGIQFIPVDMDTHQTNPFRDIRLLLHFYQLYRQLRPSIIFHYTIKPNIYGNLAAKFAGSIPTISIVPGRGYTFQKVNWLFRLVKMLYNVSLRYTKEVWFLNKEDRNFFINEGLIPDKKATVLPGEGVDTSYYSPSQYAASDSKDGITFLLSGRMLWEKGVGEFVQAARIVLKKYPTTKFHLLGFLDPKDKRVVPVETVQKWVANGIVSFMGVAEDVRFYFEQADCFVLPSYYGEGLPRTLLEAASMEIPLITSNHRGCRRAVIHGENGFLCQPKDPIDLANKMMEFIQLSKEEQKVMGKKGRQLIKSKFDEKILVDIYTKKIEELLNLPQVIEFAQ